MLPFIGRAHVGYIPTEEYVGLSKLTRTVEHFGAALTTQEDVTQQIGEFLVEKLHPLGVGVIIEAQHLCMSLRGVQRDGVQTKTSFMWGALREKPEARAEFMRLIG
jgi:GTP cyclohydrolase I